MKKFKLILAVLCFICANTYGIGVELDIALKDSISNCRYIYILTEKSDTLATFDSLAFAETRHTSLFFSIPDKQEIRLVAITNPTDTLFSDFFTVSPTQTLFSVTIEPGEINVKHKDYLYPLKKDNEHSYLFFLLLFVLIKTLIATSYIFLKEIPKRMIIVVVGVFLLSAVIDWVIPIQYLIRLLGMAIFEFLLVRLFGQKNITWAQSAIMIGITNAISFGIIFIAYLFYVFW